MPVFKNPQALICLMIFRYPTDWPQYFTASIRNWLPILAADKYKNIIADSLRSMVKDNRIELNAFVVMDKGLPAKT